MRKLIVKVDRREQTLKWARAGKSISKVSSNYVYASYWISNCRKINLLDMGMKEVKTPNSSWRKIGETRSMSSIQAKVSGVMSSNIVSNLR